MDQLFFWKDWKRPYSTIYFILLLLFILALCLFGLSYIIGNSNVLSWEIVTSVERLQVPIDTLRVHLFDQEITTDNFVIFQEYMGGSPMLNKWTSYVLLGLTTIFLIFYLTITSNLGRFWYFIFTSFAIALLLSLKFEQVLLFGAHNNSGFVASLLVYLPLSYYFQAFARNSSFSRRLIGFSMATLVLVILIYFFSGVKDPFFHLGQFGVTAPIVITAVFILITAQEFIYLFLWIITGNSGTFSRNNPIHFSVISLFYIVNLILVWLKNTQVIDWDILYLDAFLLLPIAAIIGIWGFRAKSKTLGGILPFYPWGGFLYLIMGIVAFGTLSFFFSNANDPIIEAFEDLIVYSQFGLSALFFVYILANFYTLIDNNMKVYKVVYDPKRMPYVTANIAGLIGMFALFIKSGFLAYDQAMAGYYNGLGDLYTVTEDNISAESYYEQAYLYSNQNHRSNYSLGSFYYDHGNSSDALFFFKRSLRKKPTPQAYVNTSSLYLENGMLFDALFTLQEGVKRYPGNEQISNNLGLIYSETNILDSAAYFFNRAASLNSASRVGITNLSGLVAKHSLISQYNIDSLKDVLESASSPRVRSNTMVLLNQSGSTLQKDLELPILDSLTGIDELSLIGNQMVAQRFISAPNQLEELNSFTELQSLGNFEESLKLSLAIRYYYSGNITRSIQILQELQRTSFANRENYGLILSDLLMKQGAFALSIPFLETSGFSEPVVRNLALCLSETGDRLEAARIWGELLKHDTSDNLAEKMTQALLRDEVPFMERSSEIDDQDRYLFIRYRLSEFPYDQLEILASEIQNEYLKPMSYMLLYNEVANKDSLLAEKYLEKIRQTNPVDGFIDTDHLEIQLKILEETRDWEGVESLLSTLDLNDQRLRWIASYYHSKILLENGNPGEAEVHYLALAKNPLYEPGILASVDYFVRYKKDLERAYEIILQALQINEVSIPYKMAYTRIATQLGLDSYAEGILEDLEKVLPSVEFTELQNEISILKSKQEEIIVE